MSVGENIRNLRIKCGFTQEKLADSVNIHRSYIAQIERGTKIPTITLSKDIAIALNCSLEDLLI